MPSKVWELLSSKVVDGERCVMRCLPASEGFMTSGVGY